jgi:PAS domain S-box-containing protein
MNMNIDEFSIDVDKLELERMLKIQRILDEYSIIAITDLNGIIKYANKEFCKISRYSHDELVGQNHRILKSGIHPQEFYQVMWSTISEGKIWRGELKNKAKDGTMYWVKTIIVPIIDKEGKPIEYISIRTDITKEKILFERLVESTEKLMKHDRFTAIGEITSRLVHDIRSYLTVIKSSIDLIKIKTPSTEDTTLTKYLDQIDDARVGISYQIDGVLGFVKVRSLEIKQVSLLKIIKSAIATLVKSDKIHIMLPQNDLTISCDPKQLEIVMINLLTNAIQSMGNVGQIQIRIQDNEEQAIIEVEDSGSGIPEDILLRIFEPLFTTKQTGTGLGLLSCRNIVEQHQGTISVQSTIGKGTIFKISLPKCMK